jgi:hypothetical protein
MNNNLNQPEQDDTQVGHPFPISSGPLSSQDPQSSADGLHEDFKEYEEPSVPYLPLPSESPQQPASRTSPAPGADSQAAGPPSSSPPDDTVATSPWEKGAVVLMAAVLGAILGGVVGHARGGSLVWGVVVGGSIGAGVFGVLALLSDGHPRTRYDEDWLSLLFDLMWCCPTSAVLVVASVVTIGGFLLWHGLLLAALAGGSIMLMMYIGLLNHFLAKRRVYLSDHSISYNRSSAIRTTVDE